MLTLRDMREPWSYVKNWSPIKIDALGLITLLGAEEVSQVIGSLQRRRFTEYLPLLGAFAVAGERFLDRQIGYDLYSVTDSMHVTSTVLNGWFTRWLAAQNIGNSSTEFRWTLADQPYRSPPSSHYAVLLSCVLVVPMLPCTILMGDWWGVANWASIAASILVRCGLLRQLRCQLEREWPPARQPHGESGQPMEESDKVAIVTRPDGRLATLRVPSILMFLAVKTAGTDSLFYRILTYCGWLAFGVQALALGMCSLLTQIYTVVLLVLSTFILVQKFEWDSSATGSALHYEGVDEEKHAPSFRFRPFGNRIEVEQINAATASQDKRMITFARLQLSDEEESRLRKWDLLPELHSRHWYESYYEAKRKHQAGPLEVVAMASE